MEEALIFFYKIDFVTIVKKSLNYIARNSYYFAVEL